MRDPSDELDDLEAQGLRRHLREVTSPQRTHVELGSGSDCLNFSSNDYLGLANSPDLKERFREHISRYGVGSGASRLVCGTLSPHLILEERIAALKRAEAALTFGSGFATATGVLPALCGKDDFLILDKLCHACLIDGAKLSGATMRVFPHNDVAKLRDHLKWARDKASPKTRVIVVTESVFSMDGDHAPLEDIVAAKNEFGALLLLDEAHAFGVLGPQGHGLAAEKELESSIDLQMGTFSKAVGLSGGYVCGSRDFIDLLVNRARSFIYSTAPGPALSATVADALELISGEEGDRLRDLLWKNIRSFSENAVSAIIPKIIGENEAALQASRSLLDSKFLVPAIRYPTVPRGTARLRITVSAEHEESDIEALKNALAAVSTDC
ncbi:MAG: 8-amino-7-oxononanoate synthase [Verrucomicrobiota bacterium]